MSIFLHNIMWVGVLSHQNRSRLTRHCTRFLECYSVILEDFVFLFHRNGSIAMFAVFSLAPSNPMIPTQFWRHFITLLPINTVCITVYLSYCIKLCEINDQRRERLMNGIVHIKWSLLSLRRRIHFTLCYLCDMKSFSKALIDCKRTFLRHKQRPAHKSSQSLHNSCLYSLNDSMSQQNRAASPMIRRN